MRMLLGIAGLTMLWYFCSASSAQPREVAQPKGQVPKSVTGRGETLDAAKKDAVREAAKQVAVWMKLREPALQSFTATEDYVSTHLLDKGKAGEDVQVDGIEKPFKSWIVTFRGDADSWNDVVRRDREAERKLRAETRQTLGSQVIIGLACLLLAGFGYVRLDEYTHRRYTTLLRVAGVGAAATLVAGWWWVFVAPS